MSKLPKITLAFWVMKICATTLGETAGDLLSMTLHVGYAASSVILVALFVITLLIQLRVTRYCPWLYWLVILSTSTAGTTISDFMDRTLKLGYAKGSFLLVTALGLILACWRWVTGSLSVSAVQDRRSELFYWFSILISNTLGTALGDYLADSSGFGFAGGAILIAAVLGVIILAAFYTPCSRVFLFWAAFILTRPLGATIGDVLTKPHEKGGLNLGTLNASLVLGVILLCTLWLTRSKTTRASVG